jgi:hypothetical protein
MTTTLPTPAEAINSTASLTVAVLGTVKTHLLIMAIGAPFFTFSFYL